MTLTLSPTAEKLIHDLVRSGRFATAGDAIDAGLTALLHQDVGAFAPGELEALIAEGEASIREHGTLDGDEAFAARQRARQERAAAASKATA